MPVAAPNSATFCRNNRDIARALGLRTSRKQLAQIGQWRRRADFPAPADRRGFLRAEILRWSAEYAGELAKIQSVTRALTGQRLTGRDAAALQSLSAGGPADVPVLARNQAELARVIARTFEIRCARQDIQKWRRTRDPLPAPDDAGRYDVSKCIEWVRRWKNPNGHGANGQPSLFQDAETARLEIPIIERNRARRADEIEAGQWIRRTEHDRVLSGLGKETWTNLCNLVERDLLTDLEKQLRPLGLSEEQLREFMEAATRRHHAAIDALQTIYETRIQN